MMNAERAKSSLRVFAASEQRMRSCFGASTAIWTQRSGCSQYYYLVCNIVQLSLGTRQARYLYHNYRQLQCVGYRRTLQATPKVSLFFYDINIRNSPVCLGLCENATRFQKSDAHDLKNIAGQRLTFERDYDDHTRNISGSAVRLVNSDCTPTYSVTMLVLKGVEFLLWRSTKEAEAIYMYGQLHETRQQG